MPKTSKKPKQPKAVEPWVDPLPNFGLVFQPEHTLVHRHISCARWGNGNISTYEHRKWLIENLWKHHTDSQGVNKVFETNEWSLRRLKSICENTFTIWFGAAGIGKTRDAAAIALEYWLEDPAHTAVIVCSTTKDMLRKRIWNDICELWNALPTHILDPQVPTYKGTLTDTNCLIRFNENDKKNGIFGIAVAEGPTDEAVNNIIGIHTTRYMLIIDELQGVADAIMADNVLANIASNPEVKVLGMGNPTSMMTLLCKKATPVNGWNSVVRGVTPEWEIDKGPFIGTAKALFFDGRASPAVLDPVWGAKRPWMKQKAQVDAHISAKGENDASVWTMTIGWPPPVGTDNTVLDIALIEKFDCHGKAIWTHGYENGWTLDPAFADGGDERILQFFKFGQVHYDQGARWMIDFGDWFDVPFDVDDDMREYQILNFVREKCESRGVGPSQGGTDSTGIGRGLLSVFHREWGPVIGIEFGGAASDLIVENSYRPNDLPKKGHEVFDRRSSELNIMVRRFAAAGGIKGLSKQAAEEFCQRLTFQKGNKQCVEKKSDMKKRIGRSPDHADPVCMAVEIARRRGAVPAEGVNTPEARAQVGRQQYENDARFEDGVVGQDEDWGAYYAGMR